MKINQEYYLQRYSNIFSDIIKKHSSSLKTELLLKLVTIDTVDSELYLRTTRYLDVFNFNKKRCVFKSISESGMRFEINIVVSRKKQRCYSKKALYLDALCLNSIASDVTQWIRSKIANQ